MWLNGKVNGKLNGASALHKFVYCILYILDVFFSSNFQVWRWESFGGKLKPEYTIYGILPICHIKWRPEKKYHIASCSQVLDHTVYIWDIRRSYMPFAVFEEHKDVVTGRLEDVCFWYYDTGADPGFSFRGAQKIMCVHAYHKHKARCPLQPGSRARLRALELSGL